MRDDVAGPDGSELSEGLGAWLPIATAPRDGGAGRSRLGTYLTVKSKPKMASVRRDDPSDAGPIFTEAGNALASVWGART